MFRRKVLDEMETEIRNKSIIVSQRFTEIILAVWIVICLLTKQNCVLPAYLLIAQMLVRFVSGLIYRHKVGDDRWKHSLIIALCVGAGVVFLLLISPAFLIEKGAPQ